MNPQDRFGFDKTTPELVQKVFARLYDEIVILHHRWEFFSELFEKPENASLLARLAHASFYVIGDSIADIMIMSICRLSDPASSRDYGHLTLERLTSACPKIAGLDQLWIDFRDACLPFRAHRNHRIGHTDLNAAINPYENLLPGIECSDVEKVLNLATKILKVVHRHYSRAEIAVIPPQRVGGADVLMNSVRKGYQSERELHGLGS